MLVNVSPVLDVPARPSSQEVGHGGGLAASYTQTSTDSNSSLLPLRIQISSDLNRLSPDSHCCRYKSACFLRYVMEVSSAVIGSGAHVTMVALVDNG